MDLLKLKEGVAALGFDTNLSSQAFTCAVNRALQRVNVLFPQTKTLEICHRPPENFVSDPTHEVILKDNATLQFECPTKAKAYVFECDGRGTAMIYGISANGNEQLVKSITMSSDGDFKIYRGLLAGSYSKYVAYFQGAYSYNLRNLAFYKVVTTDRAEKIPPYRDIWEYDPYAIAAEREGHNAFGGIQSVRSQTLVEGTDYFVRDEKIFISEKSSGVISVRYKYLPPYLTEAYEGELPIDERVSELLPLYVAGYAWLDDYPEKASYYLKQFEDEVRERMKNGKRADTTLIKRKRWS